MRNIIKMMLTVLALFVFQSHTLAQQTDFSGTWILNFQKSTLEYHAEGLTGNVFVIKQDGDKFRLTIYHIFGDKKKKLSFKAKADGKTRRVKIFMKCKLEKKENGLQVTLWRKNYSNIVNYKFGNNQNELIADEVQTSKKNNHHNIWVFDREVPK
jgi:hypothetical protein